eukprot:307478_1
MQFSWKLFNALTLYSCILLCNASQPSYCVPTNSSCWPSQLNINHFVSSITGNVYTAPDADYYIYVNMTMNLLVRNQYPAFIVVCETAQDIQQSISFAAQYNIQLSIISTGHSYSGRNTANNSLQINLSKMRNYKVSSDHNSITVETGLQWGYIYKIVDKYNRIIIGGSDATVGPGGYTTGGGHSPLSPYYGLSVDYILEYYMIDAQSNIIHVYNTSALNKTIDNLFYSLKGGGGGTFGVIVNITFMLHKPTIINGYNAVYTNLFCEYNFYQNPVTDSNYVWDIILNNLFTLITTNKLSDNWGGYLLVPIPNTFQIFLLYYGKESVAKQNGQLLFNLNAP